MQSVTGRAVQVGLTLGFLVSALALARSSQFYVLTLLADFVWIALVSTVLIHLIVRPFLPDLLLVILSSGLLSAISFGAMAFPPRFRVVLSFLGISSMVIMGIRSVWAEGENRSMLVRAFVPSALFVGLGWLTPPILYLLEVTHPRTLDLYLYSFDCSLRVQLSFLMGSAFLKWFWLKVISTFFYIGLPIPIAVVYADSLVHRKSLALPVMLALFYCGPLGALFYNLFPAFGPHNLFQAEFPLHPLTIAQAMHLRLEAVSGSGDRNAMPSLHMAWVLLTWWYARGLSVWTRVTALLFLAFTVIATLGTGEHYFVDLVVAFPFALLIFAGFSFSLPWGDRERTRAFLVGLLGTFAWLGVLRFGIPFFWLSPIFPWALILITAVVVIIQVQRLRNATDLKEKTNRTASLMLVSD